jgi:hypothetical protein
MATAKDSADQRTDHPKVRAGDPFYAAGIRRRTHEECIAAMHAEEERLRRKMTGSGRHSPTASTPLSTGRRFRA